jgi:hypothetical protein
VAVAPGASLSNSDIGSWLAAQLDGTHPEWPVPDANTLFALYYPPGTTVNWPGFGQSCQAFHGYHDDVVLPSGMPVPFAVITRCDSLPEVSVTGIQYVSAVASHELVEAITDPLATTSTPAWGFTDDAHQVWSLAVGGEIGDMCALNGEAFFTPPDFPYTVQRIWSNAAASAGRDPCVPAYLGGDPYFNSIPELDDSVGFTVQGQQGTTMGVRIPLGGHKTIPLDLFSVGPTQGPWSVEVIEPYAMTPHLGFGLDRSSGANGDRLQLTITASRSDPNYGAEMFLVISRLGTRSSLFFGLVGQ